MKLIKIILLSILSAVSIDAAAQDLNDAYRFSRQELTGTARFVGMSGAFGALGGDLSSLKINPAGSAVFLTNHAAFSLDQNFNNVSTRFGTLSAQTDETRRRNFDMSQAGFVFVFRNNDQGSLVNKITFGINYDRTFNHDARFSSFGSTEETIGNYFIERANGFTVNDFTPNNQNFSNFYRNLGQNFGFAAQEAYLAYESFLIDPSAQDNSTFIPNTNSSIYNNDIITRESGLNGHVAFNLGTQLYEKLYLGMNLNFHFINYDRFSSYLETNDGPGDIREVYYENDLRTRGSGFSLQFGAIYKPIKQVRIGLSYQSPTWFRIEDEIVQGIETFSQAQNEFITAFPDVVVLFPAYDFRSPMKTTFSFAYIFGKNGLLSMDYTYQDYSNQRFTSRGFEDLNFQIDNVFQATHNFNIGGEYRLGKYSFRSGYHFAESPYSAPVSNNSSGNLTDTNYQGMTIGDTNGFSLGLGYNFGNTTLDIAWRRTYLERNDNFVQTGLQSRAYVENTINNLMLSLAFQF